MKIGICTFCGAFGKVHLHHYDERNTIILCSKCHAALHRYGVLANFLGMQAEKYYINFKGYPTYLKMSPHGKVA